MKISNTLHLPIIWVIFCLPGFMWSQEYLSVNQMPEDFFGNWNNSAQQWRFEIRRAYFGVDALLWDYSLVSQNDSVYRIEISTPNKKTYKYEFSNITADKMEVKDFQYGRSYTVIRKPYDDDFKKLGPEEMSKDFFSKWYATKGGNKLIYEIGKTGIVEDGNVWEWDRIYWARDHYRMTLHHDGNYSIFYFRKFSEGYMEAGRGEQYGRYDLLKNDQLNPDMRSLPFDKWPTSLLGQWYATANTDKSGANLLIERQFVHFKGKKWKIAQIQQKDEHYQFQLTADKDGQTLTIGYLSETYLEAKGRGEGYQLYKKQASLSNNRPITRAEFPDELFGSWYETKEAGTLAFRLSEKEIIKEDDRIRIDRFARQGEWYAIEAKAQKGNFYFKPVGAEFAEIAGSDKQFRFYKKDPSGPNSANLSPDQLPVGLLGDWFSTDGKNVWIAGIQHAFLIGEDSYWDYQEIRYDGEYVEMDLKKGDKSRTFTLKDLGGGYMQLDNGRGAVRVCKKGRTMDDRRMPFMLTSNGEVHLIGNVRNFEAHPEYSTLEIIINDIALGGQESHVARLDEKGQFQLSFPKNHPQDVMLRYGKKLIEIFVSPGDKQIISLNAEDFAGFNQTDIYQERDIQFMGDGAEINRNMVAFHPEYVKNQAVYGAHNDKIKTLSAEAYKQYSMEIREKGLELLNDFALQHKVDETFLKWAQFEIDYKCAMDLIRYRWLHPRFSSIPRDEFELPENYFDFLDQFSPDQPGAMISSNYIWFLREFGNYLNQKNEVLKKSNLGFEEIKALVLEKGLLSEEERKQLEQLGDPTKEDATEETKDFFSRIRSKNRNLITAEVGRRMQRYQFDLAREYPSDFVRDILLSHALYGNIRRNQLEAAKPFISEFEETVQSNVFKEKILTKYRELEYYSQNPELPEHAILKGTPKTSGDSLLQLLVSQHTGKVIYLDFWATWCGPCIGEFPFSSHLKKSMEGKEVVFAYMALSSDSSLWKMMIAKYNLGGEHYFLNQAQANDLKAKFGVMGIPHYAIIDPKGRIAYKKAPRPSNRAAVEKAIYELLK